MSLYQQFYLFRLRIIFYMNNDTNKQQTSNELWKKLKLQSLPVNSLTLSPIKPIKPILQPLNYFFTHLHSRISENPLSISSDSEIVSIKDITYSEYSHRWRLKPEQKYSINFLLSILRQLHMTIKQNMRSLVGQFTADLQKLQGQINKLSYSYRSQIQVKNSQIRILEDQLKLRRTKISNLQSTSSFPSQSGSSSLFEHPIQREQTRSLHIYCQPNTKLPNYENREEFVSSVHQMMKKRFTRKNDRGPQNIMGNHDRCEAKNSIIKISPSSTSTNTSKGVLYPLSCTDYNGSRLIQKWFKKPTKQCQTNDMKSGYERIGMNSCKQNIKVGSRTIYFN